MGLSRREISGEEGSRITIVDTSFLVALQDEDDRFHGEALGTSLTGDRFLIPPEVWAEHMQVLLRRFAPPDVGAFMRNLLEGPFIVEPGVASADTVALVGKAGEVFAWCREQGRPPLTIFDLIVCWTAQRFREAILSFDDGIREAVRARLFPGARIA